MLSTVFFIEEKPVGYTVSEDQERYLFHPYIGTSGTVAPSFTAVRTATGWLIEGLEDTGIQEQVQIFLPALVKRDASLSAAL